MVYGLSILREPWFTIIDHYTPIGVDPEELTHVAFFWFTMYAFPTLSCEHREGMISWLQMSDTLANALNNTE